MKQLIKKEKMYIYIEGKEPVARKSKSLAEMGVKDGDNLIVTTEMKLPFDELFPPDNIFKKVLLPAPFLPIKPMRSPIPILKERFSNKTSPPNETPKFCVSSIKLYY